MRFEYLIFQPEKEGYKNKEAINSALNKLGNLGWELVSVTFTNYRGETFYFKRQL